MPDTSPILSLPYIQPSQAQKHVTHNEALRRLDVLAQTVVLDRDRSVPPAAPTAGDSHIVASPGVAAWAGQDQSIATFDGETWQFIAPLPGWVAQIITENHAVRFDGVAWAAQQPDTENLTGVGIATQSDSTNRLAVSAAATLLSHAGAGHQLKINKSAATDTASLLFQSGWSGRAEMGIAGSDRFSVKVSSDGANWVTGLEIDPDTGKITFPAGAVIDGALSGNAVQQSPDDITPGRVMRADYGYGPGNLLGSVGLSGGTPTGAVIERGSNTNGDFVRLADGTQICTHTLPLGFFDATRIEATWTFPAGFAAAAGLYLGGTFDVAAFNAGVTGPGIADVTGLRFDTITATSALAQIYRISGAAGFASGDGTACRLLAIGAWA